MENPSSKEHSTEVSDQIARSNKKPKRKITQFIFSRNEDEEMIDGSHSSDQVHAPKNPNQMQTYAPSFKDLVTETNSTSNVGLDDDDLSDDDEPPSDIINDVQCPVILLSKEEKRRLRQPWKFLLIVKMFDCKIGYISLIWRLKQKWQLKGGLILTDIGCDYFIARFSSMDDYNHVITQGP